MNIEDRLKSAIRDVPDFPKDKLTASGLVLSASGAVATADRSVMADVLPTIPTATREFTRATTVTAFLRFYQGGAKAPVATQVTTTILDATGRTVHEQTTAVEAPHFDKNRAADYQIDLPIAKLAPGPHLLTITARAGDLSIKREARFSVK